MAKKDFTGGLSLLLGDTARPESTQPKSELGAQPTPRMPITRTTQIGTREGESRATFIVNDSTHEKIKAIAYWDRLQIKDVVADALSSYVADYEKRNGLVQVIPKKSGRGS